MSRTFDAALYARVSTEDRQSPTDSIAWQRALATSLIDAQGGRIVAEYLDVGISRSLPWPRRPEAARLLADCARRDRAFGAIVIGEPQRAFAGAQFALTFPLFVHHGVELWLPEVTLRGARRHRHLRRVRSHGRVGGSATAQRKKRVGGATQTSSTRDPWEAWLIAA